MNIHARPRLAILYPGDRAARERADPAESRFLKVFDAFASAGVEAEPAIYQDDFRDECQRQSKFDPPCQSNIDPGMGADRVMVGCG